MNVRHLEERSDTRATMRVNALAWREAYDGVVPSEILSDMDPDPPADRVDAMHERQLANSDGVLVGEDDDGVVRGYAVFRWGETTKAFVGDEAAGLKELYVEPDYWGAGIGTALLERGLALLPDDVRRVTLEMLEGNEVGERFYEARGFERVGTGEFEIVDTAYPTIIYAREV